MRKRLDPALRELHCGRRRAAAPPFPINLPAGEPVRLNRAK
jgi:hypothetical protein